MKYKNGKIVTEKEALKMSRKIKIPRIDDTKKCIKCNKKISLREFRLNFLYCRECRKTLEFIDDYLNIFNLYHLSFLTQLF